LTYDYWNNLGQYKREWVQFTRGYGPAAVPLPALSASSGSARGGRRIPEATASHCRVNQSVCRRFKSCWDAVAGKAPTILPWSDSYGYGERRLGGLLGWFWSLFIVAESDALAQSRAVCPATTKPPVAIRNACSAPATPHCGLGRTAQMNARARQPVQQTRVKPSLDRNSTISGGASSAPAARPPARRDVPMAGQCSDPSGNTGRPEGTSRPGINGVASHIQA